MLPENLKKPCQLVGSPKKKRNGELEVEQRISTLTVFLITHEVSERSERSVVSLGSVREIHAGAAQQACPSVCHAVFFPPI